MRALHVKKNHGIDYAAIDLSGHATTGPKRKRVKKACDCCRKRKLRCDGERQCRQCRLEHVDCQYLSDAPALQDVARRDGDSNLDDDLDIVDVVDMEGPDRVTVSLPTPLSATGTSETLIDRSLQQAAMSLPFLFDLQPDEMNVSTDIASIMPNSATEYGTESTFQDNAEQEAMPDFWQIPFLVRRIKS